MTVGYNAECIKHEPDVRCISDCANSSYIVGDQLTGQSSADMYRRQLCQGCRHVRRVDSNDMNP
eukprot:7384460-Prymnesium_polylepis.4